MATVCQICGDVGYEHLLVSCEGCKAAVHQYCLAEVVFYGSLLRGWLCSECQPRHGEVTYERSLQKVPNQRQPSHAQFGSTVCQPSTKSVKSTREAGPWRDYKNKSHKSKSKYRRKKYSSRKNSLRRNMRPMGNKTNRRDCNATNISCASGKAFHACEAMTMEPTKASNHENQQVDNEHSVHTLNNGCVANHLPPGVKQINLQSPLHESEPPLSTTGQLNLPKEQGGSFSSLQDVETHCDMNDNVTGDCMLQRGKKNVRFQLDNEAYNDLRHRSMAVSVPQPSTLQKNAVDRSMPSSANTDVMPKESNCLPSENFEIENPKGSCVTPVLTGGNQSEPSRLLGRASSSSFSETTLKTNIVPEVSDAEVEFSDAVQPCVEANPRKRRRLILPEDDDDEEEVADVQPEDVNHRSLECDGSMSKHRIDMEDCVDKAVQTGDSNGQNLKNGRPVKKQKCVKVAEHAVQLDILIPESSEISRPVKKRRRYIEANEDEEVVIGTDNAKSALNDVSKLTSQTVVAKDHLLQSRMTFDSESANQQCCIYSQPIYEPIWSGIFKINNEVFVPLAAHLSSKACEIVWELSRSLQQVVEVIKVPRLEAWPKSWRTSGPTDDNIALYFFPPSMRTNEELDSLVEEIIESEDVLKVVVGIAELLIFPSTILPEEYHVCQGKRYLWGVFKRREDQSDKEVLAEKQNGSACAAEKGQMREPYFMDQQYELQCESSDHETSVVKHVVHVENQLLVDRNCAAPDEEGLVSPCNISSSVTPNARKVRSNCFMQPRIDPKLHAPEEVDHQKDEQDFTKPSGESGPAAVTPKSNDSAEHGAVPPATKLFGFVAARTQRAQQLIQEMVSEGALLFSVPEEMVTTGSMVGNNTGDEPHLTPDNVYPPVQESHQPIGFVPVDPYVSSTDCLELFPVWHENIGWTPRVQGGKDIDLDLSLGAHSRPPFASL